MALQLHPSLSSFPFLTRCLCLLLLSCYIVFAIARLTVSPPDLRFALRSTQDITLAFPWLVVVPGSVLWFPWTLALAAWVESGIIEFIISFVTLAFSAKYFEHIWGSTELLKFIGVVTIGSNFCCAALNVIEAVVFRSYDFYLFGMDYHGMLALQTAFFVAFTQVIPEHQIHLFAGLIKMRVKQMPMLLVTFSSLMCLIGYQSPFLLIQLGWLISWGYLRFIKWGENGEFRGDRSETFAFAGWFPPFIQPYVAKISDIVFSIFVKLRILQPWTPADLESGMVTMPARAEAERRRAMALKALTQKLNVKPRPSGQAQQGASTSSPTSTSSTNPTNLSSPGGPQTSHSNTTTTNDGEVIFDADHSPDGPPAKEKA